MKRRIFAGLPATIAFRGTSLVTTLPAPTMAFSPIFVLARIVALEPMDAPFADERLLNLPVCLGLERPHCRRGARVSVIDEHDSMTNKDVVLYGDAFANEGVAGDLAAFPDAGVLLNFNKGANLCFRPNFASVEVNELR